MTAQLGVRDKFAQARRHLARLTDSVSDYLISNPLRIEQEEDNASGDLLLRVRYRTLPPDTEWSLMAGDVIHNARSALDHLAWALVVMDGGKPTLRTQFPIAESEAKGRKAINGDGLHGVGKETREMVRALQPWHGGDEKLWRLHRLDIMDKHRLLLRSGVVNRSIWATFPGFPNRHPITGEPIEPPIIELLPTETNLLADGDVVYSILSTARNAEYNDSDLVGSFRGLTLDVCLADDDLNIHLESLGPLLLDLVTHAESSIEPLLTLLSNSG